MKNPKELACGIKVLNMVEEFIFTERKEVENFVSKYDLLEESLEKCWAVDRFFSLLRSKIPKGGIS